MHQQLQTLRLDKDRLEDEVTSLREKDFQKEGLIESQASDIKDMKVSVFRSRSFVTQENFALDFFPQQEKQFNNDKKAKEIYLNEHCIFGVLHSIDQCQNSLTFNSKCTHSADACHSF